MPENMILIEYLCFRTLHFVKNAKFGYGWSWCISAKKKLNTTCPITFMLCGYKMFALGLGLGICSNSCIKDAQALNTQVPGSLDTNNAIVKNTFNGYHQQYITYMRAQKNVNIVSVQVKEQGKNIR
ncbi:hypothetical protein SERLA73DRAFT_150207 [Serpula lacrymans var. lacrymans S7.3]|uniref:Uncharacterized protein n=2 Tax=Serpula lacrymans var. lacrymans TaxID=341189 RepID=F8PLI0_SERL3|nr:hypothetical protein SERLA73DRAFT_150207 [Serpula lacrymans var. lacrymans S7.3]